MTDWTCQKLVLLTLWPNNSLLWGCLMHWKMFSSTPGLYPLEANSKSQPTYSKYPNQWSYWWKWKMCLLFYIKTIWTFWPTQYIGPHFREFTLLMLILALSLLHLSSNEWTCKAWLLFDLVMVVMLTGCNWKKKKQSSYGLFQTFPRTCFSNCKSLPTSEP